MAVIFLGTSKNPKTPRNRGISIYEGMKRMSTTLIFNTSYLDRTQNKTLRTAPAQIDFIVWHETGGFGTLEWNLPRKVGASFTHMIDRKGTIYHYVDELRFIAWHAGKGDPRPPWNNNSRWTLPNGRLYVGYDINVHALGVELEGMNDGTPITAAQRDSAVAFMRWARDTYGIPLVYGYHPEHTQVAPYYKKDVLGATISLIVDAARALDTPAPALLFDAAWRASGGETWRAGVLFPGKKIGDPFTYEGKLHQRYERAVARLEGTQVVWLLLREIADIDRAGV